MDPYFFADYVVGFCVFVVGFVILVWYVGD